MKSGILHGNLFKQSVAYTIKKLFTVTLNLKIFLSAKKIYLKFLIFIQLGDFGFSKKFIELQLKDTKRVGTPLYLPPELINNENYDEKIDIWGLGCVLYHMTQVNNNLFSKNCHLMDKILVKLLNK